MAGKLEHMTWGWNTVWKMYSWPEKHSSQGNYENLKTVHDRPVSSTNISGLWMLMFGPHPYVNFVASYGGSEAYKFKIAHTTEQKCYKSHYCGCTIRWSNYY